MNDDGGIIDRFYGPHRFLSNFFPARICWESIWYPSTEHAFNAGKSLDMGIRSTIAVAATPAKAKRLGGPPARGGIVDLRPDWDTVHRYAVMAEVLELKFADPVLREKLLGTGRAWLIEGNNWCDTHWGVCACERHGWYGYNHLGQLLMQLRSRLRCRNDPGVMGGDASGN